MNKKKNSQKCLLLALYRGAVFMILEERSFNEGTVFIPFEGINRKRNLNKRSEEFFSVQTIYRVALIDTTR